MKTFQKLLTNSLLFAENRLCHKEGAERPAPVPEQGFEVGQRITGYGIADDKEIKVKELHGKESAMLDDKSQLVMIERDWVNTEGETIFKKGEYLRRVGGDVFKKNGEETSEQFSEYLKSEIITESEVEKKIEAAAEEARKSLEAAKTKALEALPATATEEAKQAVEDKYSQALVGVEQKTKEAKEKIKEASAYEGIEKTTAEALTKEFGAEVEKLTKEGGEEVDLEAEKGKLTDPTQLHEWLTKPENRLTMRKLVFPGEWGGVSTPTGELITSFKNVQKVLNLDDKGYKVIEKNLRIGNLLEDEMIKKITSVETKGEIMGAKYFYKGGKKIKGVYTEKSKYMPIWEGTKISFGTADLEVKEENDKEFEKTITRTSVKASAPEGQREPEPEASKAEAGTESAKEDEVPAEGKKEEAGAEPAKAEAAAKAAVEGQRTAAGLDSVKPLEPTDSKDVAGAKTFNGITYKPNGTNFDIINASAEVTNTVDATTLAVIEGKEIPTEAWMKKTIETKFPYIQGDAEFTLVENENGFKEVKAVYGDGTDGLEIKYELDRNIKEITVKGKIDQFLKDTTPETIAQFYFDAGTIDIKANLEQETEDELAKKLLDRDWAGALEILSSQDSPDSTVLALIMGSITIDDFSKVNADKIAALKGKISAKTIAEKWAEKYETSLSYLTGETIRILEKFNNGPLDEATLDEIMKCTFGDKEKLPVYEKYKSNQKIVKWCLGEYQDASLDGGTGSITEKQFLTILNGYKGGTLTGDIGGVIAAYPEIDSLSLKDEEKTALKEKCKKIFADHLTAHAKDESPEDYKEIYEILYGDDTTKLPDGASKPSPEVYAKNFVLENQDPFVEGIFDGAGWLAFDSQETNKYISAYLDAMTTLPGSVPTGQPDPTKEKSVASIIMELAKQSKNPLAKVLASKIEMNSFALIEGREANRLEEIKNLKKIAENTEDQNALTAVDALEQLGGNVEEMLKTEAGRTALGFENKDKFDTWINKQKALIQFEQGNFADIDVGQLDDPAQKEFVEAYKDPSEIDSCSRLERILATKGVKQESLKEIADSTTTKDFAKIEIYLALGLKGEAMKAAEDSEGPLTKGYYLAILGDPKNKKELLENAIKEMEYTPDDEKTTDEREDTPNTLTMELALKILKELKALGVAPDQYTFENDSSRSILEEFARWRTDDRQSDFHHAALDAKLLAAETEIAQCEDPNNPFASDHEGACDYKELANEVKNYADNLPEGQTVDKSMLERLHKLIGTNLALLGDDEDTKKAYASLMVKIDKTEGLEDYITQDAAYLESKGKFLEAAKAITDTTKPEDLKKKKELLAQALTAAGTDVAKKAEIATEYAALDDQESKETAVDIYLEAGKYEEAKDLMLKLGDESIGFIKSKLDDLADPKADQASKAEEICLTKALYNELIDQVYKVKKDMPVALDRLLKSAIYEDNSLLDKIFDLLNSDDGRTKDNFTGASDKQKKAFCVAKKAEITANDTTKKRIESKLGIENLETFIAETQPASAPTTAEEAVKATAEVVAKAEAAALATIEANKVAEDAAKATESPQPPAETPAVVPAEQPKEAPAPSSLEEGKKAIEDIL